MKEHHNTLLYFLFIQEFNQLQEMIFGQMDEQMRAMDRSLLEKIAADIEMLDKDEGTVLDMFFKQGRAIG